MNANLIRSTAVALAFTGVAFFGNGADAQETNPAPQALRVECCDSGIRVAARTNDLIREIARARGSVSARDTIPHVIGGISPDEDRGTVVLGRWTP
jgi:hypothetical protein